MRSKQRLAGDLDRVSHLALTSALVAGVVGMAVGHHHPLFDGDPNFFKHTFLFANVAFFAVMLFCKDEEE